MNQSSIDPAYVDIIATYIMTPTDINKFDGINVVGNMETVYDLISVYAHNNKKIRKIVNQTVKYGVANLHYGEQFGVEDYFVDFYGTMFYIQFYYGNYSKQLLNNHEITARIMEKLGLNDACLTYKNLFIINLFMNIRTIGNDANIVRGVAANLNRMQHVCDIMESAKVGTFYVVSDQRIIDAAFESLKDIPTCEAAKMLMEFIDRMIESKKISKTFNIKLYGRPVRGYVKNNIFYNNIIYVAKDTTFNSCLLVDYSQVIKGNICWDYADLCIACLLGKIGYEHSIEKIREAADDIDDDELFAYFDKLDDNEQDFPLKTYVIVSGIKHIACILKHYIGRSEESHIDTKDIVSVDNITFLLKQEAESEYIFHPLKLLDEGIISLTDYTAIMIKYLEIIAKL